MTKMDKLLILACLLFAAFVASLPANATGPVTSNRRDLDTCLRQFWEEFERKSSTFGQVISCNELLTFVAQINAEFVDCQELDGFILNLKDKFPREPVTLERLMECQAQLVDYMYESSGGSIPKLEISDRVYEVFVEQQKINTSQHNQ